MNRVVDGKGTKEETNRQILDAYSIAFALGSLPRICIPCATVSGIAFPTAPGSRQTSRPKRKTTISIQGTLKNS